MIVHVRDAVAACRLTGQRADIVARVADVSARVKRHIAVDLFHFAVGSVVAARAHAHRAAHNRVGHRLAAGVDELDGATELFGDKRRDGLQKPLLLGTERAAHRRLDNAHMALRHLQIVREHGANAVHGLIRTVNGQHVDIRIVVSDAGVRLHRGVMQARQLHRAAHLNETFGALLLFADLQRVFVSDGCFALQAVLARERIIKADGKRKLFILDFDKTRGSLRCFLVAGRDHADLVAHKAHVIVERTLFVR